MDILEDLFSPVGLLLLALTLLVYKWITSNNFFFADRGIPYKRPEFLFGNLRKLVLMQASFHDVALEMYKYYPHERVCGVFELRNPITMIRDPELIKQIAVRDFDHFQNHRAPIDEHADPLFGRVLFGLKSGKWRDMRSTLSPAFTGSKMRAMFDLVINCSEDMKNHLIQQSKTEGIVVEMKDLFTRFANDVIATCAFGIQINSLKDRDNEFFEMGKTVTNFGGLNSLKFLGFTTAPWVMKLLKVSLFDAKVRQFFRQLVSGTMKYRDENNIYRPDMIHLLMEARKGKLIHEKEANKSDTFAVVEEADQNKTSNNKRVWEDDDLTAQCLLFFLAGFDTSSTLLCFIGHELALNPHIQSKLLDEVDEYKDSLSGKCINYETINRMTYMDMVVNESLRKWPPAIITDRICTAPYRLNLNGQSYNFNVGDMLWIPILGIQRDEKYYPDPEKFDPERFNESNKRNINPAAFLPFGLGPRNCIGSRFALMETKAILFSLLSAFTFEKSEKTQEPLQLQKGGFSIKAANGFWIHLKPRPGISSS